MKPLPSNLTLIQTSLTAFEALVHGSGNVCTHRTSSKTASNASFLEVTEGYNTPPSSFSKAQSTGSIFRSMNDTIRDVYSNFSVDNTNNSATQKKRSRSLSPLIPVADMSSDDNDISDLSLVEPTKRPIKPLRRPRHSLLETRSLPNGPLLFGASDRTSATIEEEEDWSNEKVDEDFEQPFEPTFL